MGEEPAERLRAQAKEKGVFLVHSSADREARPYLSAFFTKAGIQGYWYPFPEGKSYPPAPRIVRAIERSAAVFVVLSKGMEAKPWTRSWVAWEAGVARGMGRPIWVFENVREAVDVPVPSCDGYVQWRTVTTSLQTHVIGELVRGAGCVVPDMEPDSDVWFEAICGNPECRDEFKALLLDPKTARCPACRQLTVSKRTLAELQARVESSV